MKNYIEELKLQIEQNKKNGFEYGKPISYLEFRNNCSIEQMEKELLELKEIKFVELQIRDEKRFKTYHVFSRTKGRVYVITFRNKIRIITIYPLGPNTIKRYKAKFKK